MGIDARMLVRRTGPALTDSELRQLAGRMVALLGPAGFHITTEGDASRPPHHALSNCETVGEALAGWMKPDGKPDPDWEGHPPDAACFSQDGPPLIGAPGEQFIEVHLITRWFGIGYPRGDWPFIRAVAEFLERHIPDGAVWYGGDSCGILLEPLDATARERLNAYFLEGGEKDFDLEGARPCPICGGRPMTRTSDPSDPVATHYCDGCGRRYVDYGPVTEPTEMKASGFDAAAGRWTIAQGRPAGEGSLVKPARAPAWWERLLRRPVRGGPGRGRLTGRRRVYRPPSWED